MKQKTILVYKKGNLIGSTGGIEKVLSFFCNSLARKGYKVYLVTRDKHQGKLFFPLDKKVHFEHLQMNFKRWRRVVGQLTFNLIPFFNRELYVSGMIRSYCNEIKPDIIITAGIQDLADIVYNNPYPCPKIVQLHSTISAFFTRKKTKLFVKTLKNADLVQVLLPSYKKDLRAFYQGKIAVIGNAVFPNPRHCLRHKIIIYPARIEPNKAQHLLIEAFSKIADKYPDWQVHFYGGMSRPEYARKCREEIKKLHLEKQILFKGISHDIPGVLAKASVCAFPSRYEGFSLALTEAMAAGLPCVGFDSAISVNELIRHGQNGYLVKDTGEMARYLDLLMKNEKQRLHMGKNAAAMMTQYAPEKIIQGWEKIIG